MRKWNSILLLFILLAFFQLRSGNFSIAEADAKGWLGKETKIGLVDFKSAHLYRSGTPVLIPFSAAAIPFAVILSSLSVGVDSSTRESFNYDLKYPEQLDLECYKSIEKVFRDTSLFLLVDKNLKNMPASKKLKMMSSLVAVGSEEEREDAIEELKEANSKIVKPFVASNQLDGALQIKIYYELTVGIKKGMAMRVVWVLFGSNGEEKYNTTTRISSEKERVVVNPDTLNPKYKDIFIELAKKSAEQFLVKLSNK